MLGKDFGVAENWVRACEQVSRVSQKRMEDRLEKKLTVVVKDGIPLFRDRFAIDQDAKAALLPDGFGEVLDQAPKARYSKARTRDDEARRTGSEVGVGDGRDVTRRGGRGKGRVVVEDDGGAEERELGRVDGAFRLEFARLGCTRRRVSCHGRRFESMVRRGGRTSPVADRALFRSAFLERDGVTLLPSRRVVTYTATDVVQRTVQGDDEVRRRKLVSVRRIWGDVDAAAA